MIVHPRAMTRTIALWKRRRGVVAASTKLTTTESSFSWREYPPMTCINSTFLFRHATTTTLKNAASVTYFSSSAAASTIDDDGSNITASSSSSSNNNNNSSKHTNGYTIQRRRGIRNVAIVAHVDHGKTTLVDELLRVAASSSLSSSSLDGSIDGNNNVESSVNADTSSSSSSSSSNNSDSLGSAGAAGGAGGEGVRLMDCGDLEKERGITITSKVTRLHYQTSDKKKLDDDDDDDDDGSYIINVVDTPGHAGKLFFGVVIFSSC